MDVDGQQPAGDLPEPGDPAGIVDDMSHAAAIHVRDVLKAQGRSKTIIIDDEENMLEALRNEARVFAVYRSESYVIADAELAERVADITTYVLSDAVNKSLFGLEKRARVFALARSPHRASLDDLDLSRGDVLVLDGVKLMGNIGAVIRSARAFGAAGVVLVGSDLRTIFDRRLIRASRGLVFSLPVVISTAEQLTEFLQRKRIPIVSLKADAQTPLSALGQVEEAVAVVLGSERRGVSGGMDGAATHHCFIPMSPVVESLNVSVSAALALYERRFHTWGSDADEPLS